ncbi:MAG: nuclear transport factor 2 family protein [Pseudomonadota bacterium]
MHIRQFFALLVLCASHAVAVAQSNPVKEIEAVEHARMAAVERRDADAAARFLTEDFASTNAQGRFLSRQQYLDAMRANPSPIKMHHDEVLVRVHGDFAVVTGRSIISQADGKTLAPTRYTHVYIRQGNEWKMMTMQNSPVAAQ